MEISESFSTSKDYTLKLLSRATELIVMIAIDIIPIVNFMLLGYYARIIRGGSSENEPPKLGQLFSEGVKILVAALVWALGPIIVGIIAGIMVLPWSIIIENVGSNLMFNVQVLTAIILVALVMVIAGILVGIYGIVGILLVAKTGDLGKTFSIKAIMSVIRSVGFGKHVIWLIAVALMGFIVGLIGFVVGMFASNLYVVSLISYVISPLLSVFLARSAAVFYEDALNNALQPLPPPPPPPP